MVATSSKTEPNRALLPPVVAWLASAGASAPVATASRMGASDDTPSARTTSRRRGWSMTATSDPPAKITRPLHQEKRVVEEVGAQRSQGLGGGHRGQREAAGGRGAGRRRCGRTGTAEGSGDHPGGGDR